MLRVHQLGKQKGLGCKNYLEVVAYQEPSETKAHV